MTETTALDKPKTRAVQLWEILEPREKVVAALLPKHISPADFLKRAWVEVTKNPRLLECTAESICQSIDESARLGLEIGDVTGEAYLVPFRNNKKGVMEAKLIPGYAGHIKLALQSGKIAFIEARVVREEDDFTYEFGDKPFCKHVPRPGRVLGEVTHAYCVVRYLTGETQFDVMNRAEIDAVRAGSRAKNDKAWTDHFPEMAKKTTINRQSKTTPKSSALSHAMFLENQAERGEDTIDVEAEVVDAPKSKADEVKELMRENAQEAQDAVEKLPEWMQGVEPGVPPEAPPEPTTPPTAPISDEEIPTEDSSGSASPAQEETQSQKGGTASGKGRNAKDKPPKRRPGRPTKIFTFIQTLGMEEWAEDLEPAFSTLTIKTKRELQTVIMLEPHLLLQFEGITKGLVDEIAARVKVKAGWDREAEAEATVEGKAAEEPQAKPPQLAPPDPPASDPPPSPPPKRATAAATPLPAAPPASGPADGSLRQTPPVVPPEAPPDNLDRHLDRLEAEYPSLYDGAAVEVHCEGLAVEKMTEAAKVALWRVLRRRIKLAEEAK